MRVDKKPAAAPVPATVGAPAPGRAESSSPDRTLTVEDVREALAPFGPVLRQLQQQLDAGPLSIEKLRQKPETLEHLVAALRKIEEDLTAKEALGAVVLGGLAAMLMSMTTKDLSTLLKDFAAFEKSGGAFVVRSAEGNIDFPGGDSAERLKVALAERIGADPREGDDLPPEVNPAP